jgi:hypothetical protein
LSRFFLEVDRNRVIFDTAGFTDCFHRLMLLET